MGITLFESEGAEERKRQPIPNSIVLGEVLENCDLPMHGKVLVRVPSLGIEVLARVAGSNAGSRKGNMFIPQRGDEVIVVLIEGNPSDGYIIGHLWNTEDALPVENPSDILSKRIIRTGMIDGPGHEIEFDDALQSITITSSTDQKVKIDPKKIEIFTTGETAKVTLDTAGNITIEAALSLTLKARQIKLDGTQVEISGQVKTDVKSNGECSINAPLVRIN